MVADDCGETVAKHRRLKRLILPSAGSVAMVFAPAIVMTTVTASACPQIVTTACARVLDGVMPWSIVGRERISFRDMDLIHTGD